MLSQFYCNNLHRYFVLFQIQIVNNNIQKTACSEIIFQLGELIDKFKD